MTQPPKLIDSHTHLNFRAFKDDRADIIDNTLDKGIWMINVGSNFETSRLAVELAEKYSRGVYAAVGLHPIHVLDEEFSEEIMLDLAGNSDKVVAVGETGLDYYHLFSERGKVAGAKDPTAVIARQQDLFNRHLELAYKLNLPLILHCRPYKDNDAYKDLFAVLEDFAARNQEFVLRGVVHCYTGDAEMAEIFIRLGLYIGFTGVITFADNYDETVRAVPLERTLIETDAPYLSPVPKRGIRNEPSHVQYVAGKIATIKDIPEEDVSAQTSCNAVELFALDNH